MGDEVPRALGPYSIVSRLATGGMAELFLGKRTGPNGFERPIAVKRILPHLARQPAFVAMFLDEARIAARLSHPNIVKVEDLGQADGELYMAMEYLAGVSVSRLMKQVAARGGALPPAVAAHVAACIAGGLHAAHHATDETGAPLELVHRDVSPENIFVTFDGQVKLLDFGVAKARDSLTHTRTGEVKGKVAYMSPEQCCAEPLDGRSDVWSLGVVLHEMLTGRRLFPQPNSVAVMRAILDEPVLPPSAFAPVPPALDAACMKALARHRDSRYASALELREELLQLLPSLGARPEETLCALLKGDFAAVEQESIELVSLVTAQPTKATPAHAPPPRRVGPALALAAAALCVVGAVAFAVTRPAAAPVVPPPAAPAPAPVAKVAEPPPPPPAAPPIVLPERVTFTITSAPAGAKVVIDGVERGTTPVSVELPRADEQVELVVQRDGYVPLKHRVYPRADLQLDYPLKRARQAPSKKATRQAPVIHRFE